MRQSCLSPRTLGRGREGGRGAEGPHRSVQALNLRERLCLRSGLAFAIPLICV